MNRKYSLKKSFEIAELLKQKRSVGDHYYIIYYIFHDQEPFQIAISISKKIRTVVEKNYEKRVIREILRSDLPLLKGMKILVIAKASVKKISFTEKKNRLLKLIRRINKEKK